MSVLDYRSPSTQSAPEPRVPPEISGHWLGWAVYLGMSWTWCIGMFLPVLIMRDFGVAGWFVFAIPNVIGAAAVGWIITSRASSQEMSRVHRPAMLAFSVVTVLFQAYFIGWLMRDVFQVPNYGSRLNFGAMGNGWSVIVTSVFALLVVGMFVAMQRRLSVDRALGWACAATSVSLLAAFFLIRRDVNVSAVVQPVGSTVDFLSLAAVSTLGFLLCPYLDPTFHYARNALDQAAARKAFAIGFGAIFLLMIVFTALYSAHLTRYTWADSALSQQALVWVVVIHMVVQTAFTSAAHLSRLPARWVVGAIVCIAAAILVGRWAQWRTLHDSGMSGGELGYRLFMSFYALIFPAYVWLCMIPGRGREAPTRFQLTLLAGAVLVSAPMFWMGFIERRMFWLLPGVAVVLLARLLIPRRTAPPIS